MSRHPSSGIIARVSLLVAVLAAVALAVAPESPVPGSSAQASVGGKSRPLAPAFTLNDLDGKSVRLSDYRGKVVVVDFWATWCGPCRREVPHLKALHDRYAKRGLVILGLSVDHQGTALVRDFVRKHAVPWRTVMADDAVLEAYGEVRGIPTAFIIDREGRIASRFEGYQDEARLEGAIKPLL